MKKRIMIVDDEEIANYLLISFIKRVTVDVDIAEYMEPAQALKELTVATPDIIFLDLNMPVIDGWAFLDKMIEWQINTPVYILTSSTSILDKQRAQKYPAVKLFISKPISKHLIAEILSAY